MQKGVHTFGFMMNVIGEGKLDQDRFWDRDSMFVTMPNPVTSLHIERDVKADRYVVTAAEPTSEVAQSALERFPIAPGQYGYTQEEVGDLLRFVRRLHANEHYRDQLALPLQETASAPAHGR